VILRKMTVPLFLLTASVTAQNPASGDWQDVAQQLGRAGQESQGIYRVTFPRSDLNVRLGGVRIRPALALTSWAAFEKAGADTTVMGDMVLVQSEVSPVISRLAEGGIAITAVHNHLVGEQPRLMYIHFHGEGNAAKLAAALRSALAATATPLNTPRRARAGAATSGLDLTRLSAILGRQGTEHDGVVSFGFPRPESISARGVALSPRMGVATAINLQAEGAGAVTTGDFVLLAPEVQPVIRALRQHGIEVMAVHNHMLDEQPRLFFLHFWGRAPAEALAQGLRAALDQTARAN